MLESRCVFSDNLDVLSSVISSAMEPSSNEGGYQVENVPAPIVSQPTNVLNLPAATSQPAFTPTININELFQKLVATGIVTTAAAENAVGNIAHPVSQTTTNISTKFTAPKKDNSGVIRPVVFGRPETLKM